MNLKIKRKVSLFLILMLSFCMSQTVFASSQVINEVACFEGSYGILWVNTNSVSTNLSFVGNKAICGARVIGKSGTTRITATVVLSLRNINGTYVPIKTWSGLETMGDLLVFDKTYYIATGYTYKLSITATVYRDGIGETVTSYYIAYAD